MPESDVIGSPRIESDRTAPTPDITLLEPIMINNKVASSMVHAYNTPISSAFGFLCLSARALPSLNPILQRLASTIRLNPKTRERFPSQDCQFTPSIINYLYTGENRAQAKSELKRVVAQVWPAGLQGKNLRRRIIDAADRDEFSAVFWQITANRLKLVLAELNTQLPTEETKGDILRIKASLNIAMNVAGIFAVFSKPEILKQKLDKLPQQFDQESLNRIHNYLVEAGVNYLPGHTPSEEA
ncbi:hypothetical protein KKD62_03525 [Patescibacteria group bacterium]|nr:hypothetical protein [Patescibacteria group bacterium]MBU1931872.1 hypothetical protein [Patescibacteria group bacterium]